MTYLRTLAACRFADSEGFTTSFTVGKKIGEGGFSIVKKIRDKKNHNNAFAAKIVDKSSLCARTQGALQEEIRILQMLDHPNIIQFHDVYEGNSKYYLVTELMAGGPISGYIASKKSRILEGEASHILTALFDAINYCHQRGIVHRDLKAENILVGDRENKRIVKIADFGFARKIYSEDSLLTLCGTPMYTAPEILRCKPYGTKVDMWSLGVLGYILYTGEFPFYTSRHIDELHYDIKRARYNKTSLFWKALAPRARNIISSLLVVNPSTRLSANQAMRLP